MISYTLSWLESNGICEIIVIANSKISSRISSYINRQYSLVNEKTKIEVHSVDGYPGTVQLMKSVKDRVKGDVFACSCDIVTNNFALDGVFDLFRKNSADLVAIFYPKVPCAVGAEGGRAAASSAPSQEEYCDVIGTTSALDNRLVFFASDTDLEENLTIGMDLFHRYGQLNVSSGFVDAHAYLIGKNSFDKLSGCSLGDEEGACGMFSVKEDWIPSIVRDSRCFAYFTGPLQCFRVNTLGAYLEANRLKAKELPEEARFPQSAGVPPQLSPKSQVGLDCVVGEGTIIGEKTSIKKSIIGTGVRVGAGVKITNSIIMDHVIVEGNCKLDGVIVAWKATIREKCNLKDCDIGAAVIVERETIAKGDCFTDGMHEEDMFE